MRPLRVESIELKNVGPFADFRLEFPPVERSDIAEVHMLTGPNGSGKSTLLHAIAGCLANSSSPARAELNKRIRGVPGSATLTANGRSLAVLQMPSSISPARAKGDRFEVGPAEDRAKNRKLLQELRSSLASGTPISKAAAFYYSGTRQLPLSKAMTGTGRSSKPLLDALDPAASVNSQALLDWIFDNQVRAALATKDQAEGEARNYQENIEVVYRILHDITGQQYSFSINRLDFEILLAQSERFTPVNVLPDGLKSLIAWLGDLLRRLEGIGIILGCPAQDIPFILLLDEADIHLHPRWQRRLLPAIQKSFPLAQIILTTHSPFVVGSVKDAWVHQLDPLKTTCKPVPSAAGESVDMILEEIFGVPEDFDPETHRLFNEFYAERDRILHGQRSSKIKDLATRLAARGPEVEDIVSRELAQLRRVTSKAADRAAL